MELNPYHQDRWVTIFNGNVFDVLPLLPDKSIDCCITSPPYWGLRDYGKEGQIGLEKTPEEYVENIVKIFREVKRILKDSGTVWLNLGDSYAGGGGINGVPDDWDSISTSNREKYANKNDPKRNAKAIGLKPKDLVGIPWRCAFALQKDGWWLRQDIIWSKPNPMPESVTDRCTKSHEYIFLLSKSQKYYFDNDAIKEKSITNDDTDRDRDNSKLNNTPGRTRMAGLKTNDYEMRNKRSVWEVTTKPYKEAHFATFPNDLIQPMVMAGTSVKGNCSMCGSPWIRVIEKTLHNDKNKPDGDEKYAAGSNLISTKTSLRCGMEFNTVGWEPQCGCNAPTIPAVILDPFVGSGTTLEVAKLNNRKSIGIELNSDYCKLIVDRIRQEVMELNI